MQNPQANSASLFANGIQETVAGRGAWGAQEFAKGVWGQKFYLGAYAQEPPQAGWGFHSRYYVSEPVGDGTYYYVLRPPDPADAADFTDQYLRENPMFREFLEADLADPVQGPGLAGQKLVKYHVLAGGIPALSYAAAANPVNGLSGFDMQNEFMNGGTWPIEGHEDPESAGKWLHSDFKNVALSYVYEMYTKMIELGRLNE